MSPELINAIQAGGTVAVIAILLYSLLTGSRGLWHYGREVREREAFWKAEIDRARRSEDRWQGIALRLLGVASQAVDKAGTAAELATRRGVRDDAEDA
jgi:hypothetical protein